MACNVTIGPIGCLVNTSAPKSPAQRRRFDRRLFLGSRGSHSGDLPSERLVWSTDGIIEFAKTWNISRGIVLVGTETGH